ncbi:hypothetical protein ACQY0O_005000 [Thecaphora frezii]
MGSSSTPPPPSHRYTEQKTLDAILGFCAVVPDLARLQRLVHIYLVEVDWKFMLTVQDYFDDYVRDLSQRVVAPCQQYERTGRSPIPLESCFQPGDLSKLSMVASFLIETLECVDPETIPGLFPASLPGAAPLPLLVHVDETATPRVRALSVLIHHLRRLIEECERIGEMTVDLVQSNLAAFSIWASQGMFGLSDFPRWEVTIRAATESKLLEDPERLGITDPLRLDHRRRLGWLVYGYDHSFAVGANVKPLIRESQFSVDRPSDAPPWVASGVPPDPTLARCEVDVAEFAKQLAVCIASDGQALHRKIMEVDQQILDFICKLDPTYSLDNPDLSMDDVDPWRRRRRPWLGLNLCWQRSVLHRAFFFPNGSINNGELATSRHIAIDSSLRALEKIREVQRAQNHFSDWQGSAWYYQYLTEPSITLATATLLLLRSKGRGIPGLADEATCWPTVFHFCKILDQSIETIDHSMRDPSLCLESFLGFGQRCSQMLVQLRTTIQSGIDALLTKTSGSMDRAGLQFDRRLAGLLNPRARTQGSSQAPRQGSSIASNTRGSISSGASSDGASPRQSISAPSFQQDYRPQHQHQQHHHHHQQAPLQALAQPQLSSQQIQAQSDQHHQPHQHSLPSQRFPDQHPHQYQQQQQQQQQHNNHHYYQHHEHRERQPSWPRGSFPEESGGSSMYSSASRSSDGQASSSNTTSPAFAQNESWLSAKDASPMVPPLPPQQQQPPQHPSYLASEQQQQPFPQQTQLPPQPELAPGAVAPLEASGDGSSIGYGSQSIVGLPALSGASFPPNPTGWNAAAAATTTVAVPAPHLSAAAATVEMLAPLDMPPTVGGVAASGYNGERREGIATMLSPTNTISSMEPSALRSYYTDDRVQRAAHENRGLSEWIASVQMGMMLSPPS